MASSQKQKSSIDFLLSDPPTQKKVPREPNVPIKSAKSKTREIIRPKNPDFSLKVLQQPSHAKVAPRPPSRVFPPFSEHRPIHPPPVLQLKVDDFKFKNDSNFLSDESLNQLYNENDPRSLERIEELKTIREMRHCKIPSWTHYSIYFITARLQTIKGTNEKMLFNNRSEISIDDSLIGTKVCSGMPISLRTSSPSNSYLKKSLPGEKPKASNFAITFVFSDLSVKKIGNFYLRFDLFEVYKGNIYWRCDTTSDEFTVYTPKKFPGPFPSTPLTSFLYKHGARIRQRKRLTPSSRKFDDTDDQNDHHNEEQNVSSHQLQDLQSSISSSSSRQRKLPKIQESTYTPYNQAAYSSQSSSSSSLPVLDSGTTTARSSNSSNPPSFHTLPPVEHFHETAFSYSNQPPPTNFRVMNPQIMSQPIHSLPMVYTQQGLVQASPHHDQPPHHPQPQLQPPLQPQHVPPPAPHHPPSAGYIKHIPVAAAYYHPAYHMVQQLPSHHLQTGPLIALANLNAQPSPIPNRNLSLNPQSINQGRTPSSSSPENGFYMGKK